MPASVETFKFIQQGSIAGPCAPLNIMFLSTLRNHPFKNNELVGYLQKKIVDAVELRPENVVMN